MLHFRCQSLNGASLLLSLVLAWLALASAPVHAQAAIQWQPTLEAAQAKAQAENKILLVELYSDSCGWCDELKKNVHPHPKVIDALNRHFVAVRLKGNPGKLREIHGSRGTPHTLLLDPQSMTLLNRMLGYVPPVFYLQVLARTRMRAELHQLNNEACQFLDQSDQLVDKKQFGQAIALMDQALEKTPGQVDLLYERGRARVRQSAGDPATLAQAIEDLTAAIKLDGRDPSLRIERGLAYYASGKTSPAIADLQAALQAWDREEATALIHLWFVLAATGQEKRAQALLHQRYADIKGGWDRQFLRYLMGQVSEEHLLKNARGAYRKQLAYRMAGMKAFLAGDRDQAIAHLRVAVAQNSPSSWSHATSAAELRALLKSAPSDR